MKIITRSITAVTAVLLVSSASGRAGDWKENLYINADAGGIFQQDAIFNENGWSSTAAFNPGARIDLAVGYHLSDSLAVELEPGFMWNSVDSLNGFSLGQLGQNVDLYSIPVLANLVFNFPTQGGWTPYVGIGAGANISIFDGNTPRASYNDTAVAFAYQAEAGVKYAFSYCALFGIAYKFLGTTDQDYSFNFPYHTSNISLQGIYIHGIFVNFTWHF